MQIHKLSAEETRESGFTHKAIITYADLTAAATSQALTVLSGMVPGWLLTDAAYYMPTVFSGGAASGLTVSLGWDGATNDNATGLIAATSILSGHTPIVASDGTGAAFAAARSGYAPIDASCSVVATFTSTGANVSTFTAGEIHFFFSAVDLTTL